ncbi:class I SAM-dependent methyltransferase [Acinetobacter sp. ANC 4635]|uniref:class I SAM-dependent DNA methyltransferase n=1 Tax=Acinetobacter sp. ANC 4635 TaxID=2529846 RepID=UPI0010401745|nr:class I SAM-dependent methyltransferase [Acinetobacter sp. ANC 4635]TCB33156.1 class I SAM-dependent methyltransferase [Acinetobacter sp. ANC 4635]
MTQEHLAENIIEIYRQYGRQWTNLRGTHLYEKQWLDRFLALLPTSSHILDLGCGSGKPIAAYLIDQGCRITGVDSAEVMLEMARSHFPDQQWVRADMRTFSSTQKFQGILAWDSFFHLTRSDQRDMFARFKQLSQTGTVLMFTSGPANGESIGEMFGQPLYHASLAPEEYRFLLHQHGFQLIHMLAEDADCAGHTVWLAQKQPQ